MTQNEVVSNMKLVMLHGSHNCGKTTVLQNLLNHLIDLGATEIVPRRKLIWEGDFECLIEYSGKRIAFSSFGDYLFPIIRAIGYFDALQADVLIIASSKNSVQHWTMDRRYPDNVSIEKNHLSDEQAQNIILSEIGL